jgi:hypothetical protein
MPFRAIVAHGRKERGLMEGEDFKPRRDRLGAPETSNSEQDFTHSRFTFAGSVLIGLSEEYCNLRFQRASEYDQGRQCDVSLSPLNCSHVAPIDVTQVTQILLRPTPPLSKVANATSDCLLGFSLFCHKMTTTLHRT